MSNDSSNLKYNLNDLYRQVVDKDTTFSFGAYQGNLSMVVLGRGRMVWRQTANQWFIEMFSRTLRALKKAGPETRQSMSIDAWNNDLKKFEPETIITFGKNEKMVMYLEIKPKNSAPITVTFKGQRNITVGSEPMSEGERSMIDVDIFLRILEQNAEGARELSSFNRPPRDTQGGGERRSYGGGHSGGSAPSASSGGGSSRYSDESF